MVPEKQMMRSRTDSRAPSLRLSFVALLVFVLLLGACGEDDAVGNGGVAATPTPSASPTPEPIEHPTGDDDIILQVTWQGGFAPVEALISRLPLATLLGNGCLITEGPQIEIYPQPILPNLQEVCLTDEGVQAILNAARDAGLLDGDATYGHDMIADAATTVFVTNAGGKTTTVSAYALYEGTEPTGTPEADAAREKLTTFLNQLGSLRDWLPETAFSGEDHACDVTRMQIIALPVQTTPDMATPEIEPQQLDWPLATPLAELGEPYPLLQDARCVVLDGEDLATLMTQLQDANQLTQWTSGDDLYSLLVRPLVGAEDGCVTQP